MSEYAAVCAAPENRRAAGEIVYLKALEMVGFKSFAERTKLVFEPGMMAIVAVSYTHLTLPTIYSV